MNRANRGRLFMASMLLASVGLCSAPSFAVEDTEYAAPTLAQVSTQPELEVFPVARVDNEPFQVTSRGGGMARLAIAKDVPFAGRSFYIRVIRGTRESLAALKPDNDDCYTLYSVTIEVRDPKNVLFYADSHWLSVDNVRGVVPTLWLLTLESKPDGTGPVKYEALRIKHAPFQSYLKLAEPIEIIPRGAFDADARKAIASPSSAVDYIVQKCIERVRLTGEPETEEILAWKTAVDCQEATL